MKCAVSLFFTFHMPFNKIQCISWAFSSYRVQSYQDIELVSVI